MPSTLHPMTERETLQRHLDEITFNLFVDCGCHLRETVAQSGLAASTVRARVRRHSLRPDSPEFQRRLNEALNREAGA
jgi:hypothetical protein